jgi:hypothetical protein
LGEGNQTVSGLGEPNTLTPILKKLEIHKGGCLATQHLVKAAQAER